MDHAGMEQDRLELEYYRTGRVPKEWTKKYRAAQEKRRQEAFALAKEAGVTPDDGIVQESLKILAHILRGKK